uniref:Ig-like domain-containing protein n=1 Tax=Xenopus tropicalis TaxID=8364 RepID=A0A6I8QLG0_XENTR
QKQNVLLFCGFLKCIHCCMGCNTQVFQTPLMIAEEGQDITLKCNHSIKTYNFLAWYKQLPGSSLEICASGVLQATNICRVTMSIDKASLSTQLSISKVQVEESALYYCAVSDTVTET